MKKVAVVIVAALLLAAYGCSSDDSLSSEEKQDRRACAAESATNDAMFQAIEERLTFYAPADQGPGEGWADLNDLLRQLEDTLAAKSCS